MSDEHLLRLRKIMQSLATRVPKIMLQRVEEVYPLLKESLQNFDAIKVENDFLIKEKSIDMKSEKVCASASSSIKEAEPKENAVSIKVEIDDVIEENSIDMETDEVYRPSVCSINKVEPKKNDAPIKVEIDDVIEENSIDTENDEVYTPSACSINKVEPKQNDVSIKVETDDVIEENSIDMETELACSIKEVEPKICTILLKDVPGSSSETCNWVINVKVEEDDPLAIAFPAVKAEPGVCKGSKMSSMSPSDEGPEGDGLAHCADYVDSQSSDIVMKNEVCRKEAPVYEERCDSTDSSDDSASVAPSACVKKRKAKAIKLKDERLDLQCEWRDCDYRTGNLDHFVRHVSLHIPHLEVKMTDDQEGVYVCLWEQCGFESADSNEITRHVNFHSYHTKVKCIGSNILARSKLPVCTLHCAGKNVIPDLPHAFECCWQTCEQTFNNSQIYFNHVEAHVYCNPRGRVVEGGIPCHWSGCMSNSVYPSIWKLAEHVRTHTQEKLVGCPTCGGLFASRARFSYHCMHQVPSELRGYQFRSKKAVNNHLKCPFCDKTCSCPSNLSVHIRYRHLDSKPFKCSSCEYRAKTHHDLKVHWNTHRSDPLYHCKEKGCDFSCRSAYGLRRHCDRCHAGCDQPQYCCHICDSLFQRGSLLTRHLRKRHSICRPSGQCRFRYKQNGDGLFRLLTTDTETMKVTQKVMVLEVRQPFCINEDDPLTQEAGGEILSS
ncbi:hypothetical protein B7P43_G16827 [Cryptotermes secundus]|uniref:C2H2-type domain-containing protein n=2 Tax=Cryptotermes secundus TaxID=105785 RepID=A0A2J7PMH7_9NEOP|nr:hypothetical protein B7P43_G16827 [Cryptotermes secundus]